MKRLSSLILCGLLACSTLSAEGGKVAVVLGGGGSRGYAEVALLEKIESYGIPVDMVLGTSIGSLIGGLYATGWTPRQIASYVRSHNLNAVVIQPASSRAFSLTDPFEPRRDNILGVSFSDDGLQIGSRNSLFSDAALLQMLAELFGDQAGVTDFDRLPVPFRAVATNAMDGSRIVYDHGSLLDAVRSSISIPIVFAPYPQADGTYAVDGGMVDNLPIDVARELGADYVIAMEVSPEARPTSDTMHSLLGVAIQTINLATPDVSRQYGDADIMVVSDTGQDNMLDFKAYDYFHEKGVAAVEAHDDEFRALAERLREAGRVVEPKDPDRPYVTRGPSRRISRVVVEDRSFTPSAYRIHESVFAKWVGQYLTDANRQKLVEDLERLQVSRQLASIRYTIRNDEDPGTMTLVIQYEDFAIGADSFSLSAYGSLGASNQDEASGGHVWLGFDVRETLELQNRTRHGLDLILAARQGNVTSIAATVRQPILRTASHEVLADLRLEAGLGGYSVGASQGKVERDVPLDRELGASADLAYVYANFWKVQFGTAWKDDFLHKDDGHLSVLSQWLGVSVDNRRQRGLAQSGVRFDLKTSLGMELTERDMVWAAETSLRQDFAFHSGSWMIGYDLHLDMNRMPRELTDSYLDIGGFPGVPGLRYGTLRQDAFLAGLRWRLKLGTVASSPLYLLTRVSGGIIGDREPFLGEWTDDVPFSKDVEGRMGFGCALAIDTSLGNFAAGVGVTVDGDVSVQVGIIE